MNFTEIAQNRQSCRNYDENRPVEQEKLLACLEAARLAPSACNRQPYHFTVCRGETAKEAARACMAMGMNKFADKAPVIIVISEEPFLKPILNNCGGNDTDRRPIDIGIAAAYLTAEATAQGLSTCIIAWLDDKKLRKICGLKYPVRLVIALGYAAEDDVLRQKKRKDLSELVTEL